MKKERKEQESRNTKSGRDVGIVLSLCLHYTDPNVTTLRGPWGANPNLSEQTSKASQPNTGRGLKPANYLALTTCIEWTEW